ncbi:MerR HTH family regulatory protein [Micromonospora nigra]|uniref:MerR HTH family regulatory protein n=1 Tax=Micromonospora nigra TaxID=145857 RepID=A0A1C6SYH4_9ACTN|nr:MerR family transcriptional regulator [Micromonospora nigra]SCL34362.1 MerR HTH family regulatory protein [Micromonospora nigra]
MRISDLCRQTGVPVATIKFYLREGLLPPGEPTGRNQAQYGEAHRRQLWLIRAFTNIGQLELSAVGELLKAIEDDLPWPELYDVVNRALFPEEAADRTTGEMTRAHAEIDRFFEDLNWQIRESTPGRNRLAEVLAAMKRLGCDSGVDFFLPLAQAAESLTAHEMDQLPTETAADDRAAAVARTVLLDAAFAALRRMAQEHVVTQRLGAVPGDKDPTE